MAWDIPADTFARMAETPHPPLTSSDAWLLAAITEVSPGGQSVSLTQFVDAADWLNRAIPTFDEVSFGVPRLVAAGLMAVDGLALRSTPKARRARGTVHPSTLGGVLYAMEDLVGAAHYGELQPPEDRSLGRWPSLTPDDLDRAVREHSAQVERWSRPVLAAARVGNAIGTHLVRVRDRLKR